MPIDVISVADIGGIADNWNMTDPTSSPPSRNWFRLSWLIYLALLIPASLLAYIGFLWVDASARGWQTQIAAAALIAAWFPVALGAFRTRPSSVEVGPSRLSTAGYFFAALFFYAVAFSWGGRMLI